MNIIYFTTRVSKRNKSEIRENPKLVYFLFEIEILSLLIEIVENSLFLNYYFFIFLRMIFLLSMETEAIYLNQAA